MFEIKAWYVFRGTKGFARFEVDAQSLQDAFGQVIKHMAGGFGLPAGNWIIPDRVLISDWAKK